MANTSTTIPSQRQPSSSSAFNFASSDSSDLEDDTPLPFPAALPRSDFLAPDFNPAEYLSALPHRHQTLEDLRSDLRDRSAAISAELLELVNSNSNAFLSLGTDLRGGGDKVEDVKVALLGFRRAVEEVKAKVSAKSAESELLTDELRNVRSDIEVGRKMIEASERMASLEETLALDSLPSKAGDLDLNTDDEADEEEEESDGLIGSPPAKLLASARDYRQIETLLSSLDRDIPLVVKLEARLTKCRNTLLLDLHNALKESRKAGAKGQERTLKYLAIFRMLDAQGEAIKALKSK
ncbi:hypothetical protein K4F52_005537 [Lecanicillium sp. MT-2017a]|nr:hypothetical protein K4F52_005537 [Lecanicillium sp. MT-2017a]